MKMTETESRDVKIAFLEEERKTLEFTIKDAQYTITESTNRIAHIDTTLKEMRAYAKKP